MRPQHALVVLCAVAMVATGQAPPTSPVVEPRGVVNAYTKQPAPTVVGPGGTLVVTGLNLGPAMGLKADGPNWPTRLGDVEVMINGRPAAIASAEPGRIVVQVPWEIQNGLAQLVVRRGNAASRPVRFSVNALTPSVRTTGDTGFGPAFGVTGSSVKLNVTGLGPTEPRLANGEVGEALPRNEVRAYVGGLPVTPAVSASKERPGEFDIAFEAPAGAVLGDLVTVVAGGRSANRTTMGTQSLPQVLYVRLPEGTPEIRAIQSADLRGTLVAASTARSEQGCYRSWLFDLSAGKAGGFDECVTTANRQIAQPFIVAPESSSIAALIGPPQGEAPNPVSAKVKLVSAAKPEPMTVDLPSAATALVSMNTGNFVAVLGQGAAPIEIDSETGETRELQAGAAAGLAGGGGQAVLNPNTLRVDLGDGLDEILSNPVGIQQGVFALIVGNDTDKPTKAKLAAVNAQGEVQQSIDFPEGWVPLIPPAQQLPAGVQAPAALQRQRLSVQFDAQSRGYFVMARRSDGSRHGMVVFSLDDTPARAVELPDGWFAATCSARVAFLQLELARRIAFFADRQDAGAIRNPCQAQGYALFDMTARTLEVVGVPGSGLMNASGAADEMNDFVFATNIDASRNNRSDTVFVLDGVTGTPYRFDPPSGVAAIGQVVRVPEMNLLIAPGTNRAQGDGGFVIFDLDRVETRVLPSPEGFTAVQFLGVLPATRALVARGIKADGAQLLIYDLVTGDLLMPANPTGVAWFGPPVQTANPGGGQPGGGQPGGGLPGGGLPGGGQPGAGGQPAQQQTPLIAIRANIRANTVEAIGYDSERRQVGVIVVRVP